MEIGNGKIKLICKDQKMDKGYGLESL
ncbi:uncharacterized protein METZ01_LOCUS236624 [marine metagenome]|uniref:Uncharacterized protein n=1 Tax=marine metagenome TaxID=408172 RepID=A0A382H927_9ZZZZ